MSIHFSDDDGNITYYSFNPALEDFLLKRGWSLHQKLGEGAVSDVFEVHRGNLKAALVLFSNVKFDEEEEGDYSLKNQLRVARSFPDIFTIIYDTFKTSIPYSMDPEYRKKSRDFESRTIQIIEKVDMTLDAYALSIDKTEIFPFSKIIVSTLTDFINKLSKAGIWYTDLKLDNIGVIIGDEVILRLLDLESISFLTEPLFSIEEMVMGIRNRFIDLGIRGKPYDY